MSVIFPFSLEAVLYASLKATSPKCKISSSFEIYSFNLFIKNLSKSYILPFSLFECEEARTTEYLNVRNAYRLLFSYQANFSFICEINKNTTNETSAYIISNPKIVMIIPIEITAKKEVFVFKILSAARDTKKYISTKTPFE